MYRLIMVLIAFVVCGCNAQSKPIEVKQVDSLIIYQIRFETLTAELLRKYGNVSNEWSKQEKDNWNKLNVKFQSLGGYTEVFKRYKQ